ncbi:Cys-Cys-COOH (seleno)protein SaoC [Desulfonatronum sp. SC1]|uniref:Cys-Cys-COOH (seleno)protein SaoC n=1 Tax=Desulfonatronum sp. SC1 TaxID=2109626 RepID=UPI000D32326D|nr:Cys-Cys-COOH (seleno)protein SaoC [Desulfonatronum sp. SC1]PTN32247.1 hypothetical protein C6366_16865 [Desulfonatronum sp. SC1]
MKCLFFIKMLAAAALLFSASGCTELATPPLGDQKDFCPDVLNHNTLLRNFAESYPGNPILKYAQADLNDNGQEDLIVIYQVVKGQNEMRVLLNHGTDYFVSDPVPAPVSDQMIQFKDIDNKPPLEFLVQGRKGPFIGYAIFRVEDGEIVDLFSEGMADCC